MPALKTYMLFTGLFALALKGLAQTEVDRSASFGVLSGVISYQGDLQPNSFSFQQASFFAGVSVRQPLPLRFSLKAGFSRGSFHAADAANREYLKVRNLSFYTHINEAMLALDYELLNLSQRRYTPFGYGGVVYFHYNPYTFDKTGKKVYLQPLGTEGQGLDRYPDRKFYKLSQIALAFGGGLRFLIRDAVIVGLEVGQRKTFTDYLDDVSKSYADATALQAARGSAAVDLAYRGDELPGGAAYPKEGEQRGTPTQMDWYYLAGISVEIKLSALTKSGREKYSGRKSVYNMRCPKVN